MPILRQVDEDGLTFNWNITPFVGSKNKKNMEVKRQWMN